MRRIILTVCTLLALATPALAETWTPIAPGAAPTNGQVSGCILRTSTVAPSDGQSMASSCDMPDGQTFTNDGGVNGATQNVAIATLSAAKMVGQGYITFQFPTIGTTPTITVRASNDGGTTYDTVAFWRIDSSSSAAATSATATTTAMYAAPITGALMQIYRTDAGGGATTVNGVIKKGSAPIAAQPNVSIAGTAAVAGSVASGSADSGNPVKVGCKYNATAVTFTTGNRADCQANIDGALVTKPYAAAANTWFFAAPAAGITNTTTAVTIHASCGAGLKNYLDDMQIDADTLGAATELVIRDGAAGTVVWRGKLQTGGTSNKTFHSEGLVSGTAATLMEAATLTAVTGGVYVNGSGHCAP